MKAKRKPDSLFKRFPRPWRVYNVNRVIEVQDANGKAVIHWVGLDDDGVRSYTARLRLAQRIAAIGREVPRAKRARKGKR